MASGAGEPDMSDKRVNDGDSDVPDGGSRPGPDEEDATEHGTTDLGGQDPANDTTADESADDNSEEHADAGDTPAPDHTVTDAENGTDDDDDVPESEPTDTATEPTATDAEYGD